MTVKNILGIILAVLFFGSIIVTPVLLGWWAWWETLLILSLVAAIVGIINLIVWLLD